MLDNDLLAIARTGMALASGLEGLASATVPERIVPTILVSTPRLQMLL